MKIICIDSEKMDSNFSQNHIVKEYNSNIIPIIGDSIFIKEGLYKVINRTFVPEENLVSLLLKS